MNNFRDFRRAVRALARPAVMVFALGGLAFGMAAEAQAQQAVPHRRIASHTRTGGLVAGRVLTVHRHAPRFATLSRREFGYDDGGYYAPAPIRRWNDPNLDSFGGWRLGGDNFYGDQAGDTITRGNSALGAIAGYGPANGGYGGPHFDSVGGFHNGPGPDVQEDEDYASGSISRPDYGGIVPHYPSVKARVAALMTGVPRSGTIARPTRIAPAAVAFRPSEETHYLREDDLFPDLGTDEF